MGDYTSIKKKKEPKGYLVTVLIEAEFPLSQKDKANFRRRIRDCFSTSEHGTGTLSCVFSNGISNEIKLSRLGLIYIEEW